MSKAAATDLVVPNQPWLSQGDIFEKVPLLEAGVVKSMATAVLTPGPAMLVTHDCAIDKKKGRGRSALEYLTFLPVQSVVAMESHDKQRAAKLRTDAANLEPLGILYLGDVPQLGEAYVNLTRPYTLPSLLLSTELRDFTAEETGEGPDRRIVPTVWETRCCTLSEPVLQLLRRKWNAHWTRTLPPPPI